MIRIQNLVVLTDLNNGGEDAAEAKTITDRPEMLHVNLSFLVNFAK